MIVCMVVNFLKLNFGPYIIIFYIFLSNNNSWFTKHRGYLWSPYVYTSMFDEKFGYPEKLNLYDL